MSLNIDRSYRENKRVRQRATKRGSDESGKLSLKKYRQTEDLQTEEIRERERKR